MNKENRVKNIIAGFAATATMLGFAATVVGAGTAQAAAPQDCTVQRDAFGATAQCPVGGDSFYDLTIECFGLNWPFAQAPAVGTYSRTNSSLAVGPNVYARCNEGSGVFGVVTNAYVTPRRL